MDLNAVAACVGLAFIYDLTKEQIAINENKDLELALFEVFPGADGFIPLEEDIESPDETVRFDSAWALREGNKTVGIAIRTLAESYGGTLTSLVGVGKEAEISGVRILANGDTPGLGANAASPTYYVDKSTKTSFYGQFAGKNANDPFVVKEDIVAITASTITSVAVSKSVKAAALAALDWLNQSDNRHLKKD